MLTSAPYVKLIKLAMFNQLSKTRAQISQYDNSTKQRRELLCCNASPQLKLQILSALIHKTFIALYIRPVFQYKKVSMVSDDRSKVISGLNKYNKHNYLEGNWSASAITTFFLFILFN